jgi:cysteinyl-tRNA synthetase
MSNSLGNAIQIRRILRRYNPNIIRLYFLSEHYRRPMDFSESTLGRLEKLDKKISKAISLIRVAGGKDSEDFAIMKPLTRYIENDFDTVGILTLLTDRIGKGNASAKFLEITQILGLNY